MIDLLTSAANKETNREFSFFLGGDLNQMSAQRNFLNSRGITTKQNDVYPCLKQEDVEKALTLIWTQRVEGWWHYKDKYVEHNICTAEEFDTRLKSC